MPNWTKNWLPGVQNRVPNAKYRLSGVQSWIPKHKIPKIESKRSTIDTPPLPSPKIESKRSQIESKMPNWTKNWLPGVQSWVPNAQNRLPEVQTWVPKAQNRLSKVQSWTVEPQNQDKVDTWRPKNIPPSLKSNRRCLKLTPQAQVLKFNPRGL